MQTKMFDRLQLDPSVYTAEPMTYQYHRWGLSLDVFRSDYGLASMFTPTSTSTDNETGHTFVATMESPRYPFYGTLFHPEKPFEANKTDFYNDSGMAYNRYFAQKLVEEARKSRDCRVGTPSDPLQMPQQIDTEGSVINKVRYYGKVHVYPPSHSEENRPNQDRSANSSNSYTYTVVDNKGRRVQLKGKLALFVRESFKILQSSLWHSGFPEKSLCWLFNTGF